MRVLLVLFCCLFVSSSFAVDNGLALTPAMVLFQEKITSLISLIPYFFCFDTFQKRGITLGMTINVMSLLMM